MAVGALCAENTIAAIDVPSAIATVCCVAIPAVLNAYTSAGTMIRPPPMPNRPAKNPAAIPLRVNTANVSSMLTLVSIVGVQFVFRD
jgi:hypothetical protein